VNEVLDRCLKTLKLCDAALSVKEDFDGDNGTAIGHPGGVSPGAGRLRGTSGTATDPGITGNSITLGVTIAQSGPAAAYGTIANASNAYFKYINDQGGVNGRKINYKILDDGYNPAKAVPLTKQLVEQDKVFAMFGGLGTQPQTAVRDYLNNARCLSSSSLPGRRLSWRFQLAPVHDRLAASLPGRVADLRQGRARQSPSRQDRRALPERRLRPGLSERS